MHVGAIACSLSLAGLIVTASILLVTLIEKFTEGGWMTVLITGTVIAFCLLNHGHYASIKKKIRIADEALSWTDYPPVAHPPQLDHAAPTAVFVVGSSRSGGVYALQWVRREFPGHFKNFIFMNVRTVDAQSYGGGENFERVRQEAEAALQLLYQLLPQQQSCRQILPRLRHRSHRRADQACRGDPQEFSDSIFFTSKLILKYDNWYIRQLHSEAALTMLRQLHLRDIAMVVLPMRL